MENLQIPIIPNTSVSGIFLSGQRNGLKITKMLIQKFLCICTGGIRCEKSTSYMKKLGFDKVYHLKGGILEYLKETNSEVNDWKGNCFVFDDRVAVDAQMILWRD